MTLKSWTELALAEGQNVYAQVKYVSLNPGRGEFLRGRTRTLNL